MDEGTVHGFAEEVGPRILDFWQFDIQPLSITAPVNWRIVSRADCCNKSFRATSYACMNLSIVT